MLVRPVRSAKAVSKLEQSVSVVMVFSEGVFTPTQTRKQRFMATVAEPVLDVIVEALITAKPVEALPRFVCKVLSQELALGSSKSHASVDSVDALSYCKQYVDPLLEVCPRVYSRSCCAS